MCKMFSLMYLNTLPNFISFCGIVQEICIGFWTPSMVFLEAYGRPVGSIFALELWTYLLDYR